MFSLCWALLSGQADSLRPSSMTQNNRFNKSYYIKNAVLCNELLQLTSLLISVLLLYNCTKHTYLEQLSLTKELYITVSSRNVALKTQNINSITHRAMDHLLALRVCVVDDTQFTTPNFTSVIKKWAEFWLRFLCCCRHFEWG